VRCFSLKPLHKAGGSPNYGITGVVGRHFNELFIGYELSGDPEALVFPAPSSLPLRRRGLWEETCFEFFLAPKDVDYYWEFNLSPAGHWNVYRFTSYRQGMKEEQAIAGLPFSVTVDAHVLRVSMKLNLGGIIQPGVTLKVAISAVIKTLNAGITHWALVLTGPKADFHSKDNFIIEL
jgi:hypothetical protein